MGFRSPAGAAACNLTLPVFEGPLDLLLNLIEENKLPITEVSLAAVADQYVTYVKCLEEIDPASVMGYLLIAVRLMLIKSQVLLPRPPEPDEDAVESAGDLLAQLEAYQRAKAAAELLRRMEDSHSRTFLRPSRPSLRPAPPPLEPMHVQELTEALAQMLLRLQPAGVEELDLPPQVSIEAKMEEILVLLQSGAAVPFRHIVRSGSTRDELVATFLAVLQLLKRREIEVSQDKALADIWIRRGDGS